jgi:hypothetical protein
MNTSCHISLVDGPKGMKKDTSGDAWVCKGRRDNLACITTEYGLDGRGSAAVTGKIFLNTTASRLAIEITHPFSMSKRSKISQGVKRPGCAADRPLISTYADVKNAGAIAHSPYVFKVESILKHRDNILLPDRYGDLLCVVPLAQDRFRRHFLVNRYPLRMIITFKSSITNYVEPSTTR